VFDLLNEMGDEETRAIVDTTFVSEQLNVQEHLRLAEDALLCGPRPAAAVFPDVRGWFTHLEAKAEG
jgi:hypothetical protein